MSIRSTLTLLNQAINAKSDKDLIPVVEVLEKKTPSLLRLFSKAGKPAFGQVDLSMLPVGVEMMPWGEKRYDPRQPRDIAGRWTATGENTDNSSIDTDNPNNQDISHGQEDKGNQGGGSGAGASLAGGYRKTTDSEREGFHRSLVEAKAAHNFGAAVTDHGVDYYLDPDKEIYQTHDGMGGAVVTGDGDVVSVFKHPDSTESMQPLFAALRDNPKVKTGDAFDIGGFLPTLYQRTMGWVPAAIVKWNDEFAPEGWDAEKFGKPDIVLMAADPHNVLMANFDHYNDIRHAVPVFHDWDKADEHRGHMVKAIAKYVKGGKKFNPDEPRDEHGRWTDGTAAIHEARDTAKTELEAYLSEWKGKPVRPDEKETIDSYRDKDGEFTEERTKLHRLIMDYFKAGVTGVEKPVAHFMGGGPAAGKSSILKAGAVKLTENKVEINADEIKELIPEYREGLKTKDPTTAARIHEESSYISKRLMAEAVKESMNVLIDGTGNTGFDSIKSKVESVKGTGHEVHATYVTVPTEMAIARNHDRFKKTGRYVPDDYVAAIHASVSSIVPKAMDEGLFKSIQVYDTGKGGKPLLVASATKGQRHIHNRAAWLEFLAKATGKKSKKLSTTEWEQLISDILLGRAVPTGNEALESTLLANKGIVAMPHEWIGHEGELKQVSTKSANKPERKGCVLVNLPEGLSGLVLDFGSGIPEDEIYTSDDVKGRETRPHVTLLYGLMCDAAEVREALKDFGPIDLRLTETSVFECEEYDVLKFGVESPDLGRANGLLRGLMEGDGDHPVYQPHITIAYMKKGEAHKYAGSNYLSEMACVITKAVYSTAEREKHPIDLE